MAAFKRKKLLALADVSRFKFMHTMAWAVFASCVIVAAAAFLGRASLNLKAAITDKPDLAVYLLLPDKDVSRAELLRDRGTERDYLIETNEGPELLQIERFEGKWRVKSEEKLRP
jgi:hypothetical protein